jgi:hypothetical protein
LLAVEVAGVDEVGDGTGVDLPVDLDVLGAALSSLR